MVGKNQLNKHIILTVITETLASTRNVCVFVAQGCEKKTKKKHLGITVNVFK